LRVTDRSAQRAALAQALRIALRSRLVNGVLISNGGPMGTAVNKWRHERRRASPHARLRRSAASCVAMSLQVDGLAGPCAETAAMLALPGRWGQWARPWRWDATPEGDVDSVMAALSERGIDVHVYSSTADLGANPLGTWAAYLSARAWSSQPQRISWSSAPTTIHCDVGVPPVRGRFAAFVDGTLHDTVRCPLPADQCLLASEWAASEAPPVEPPGAHEIPVATSTGSSGTPPQVIP
jgi:hypothetical protein